MAAASNYNAASADRYWAASEPDMIAPAICYQWRRWQERTRADGRYEIWRTADRCYHGRNPDGGYSNAIEITFGGHSGEVAQLHVGHFRSIIGAQLTLATEQRPAVECTATSNDPEAISETIVARQALEYDLDEGGLEQDVHATHERALVYSEGYLLQDWDFNAGDLIGTRPLAPDVIDTSADGVPGAEGEGKELVEQEGIDLPVRAGEPRTIVLGPMDVAHDLDRRTVSGDPPWYIVRISVHRWELAARYPESAEKRAAILGAPSVSSDDWFISGRGKRQAGDVDGDYIYMLVLLHPPSDALPQGRIVEVVEEQWLSDDPYPYDHMVVHRNVPSAELGTAMGYGDAWEMLAIAQALDAVESGMLSVADAGALVRYAAPRGQKVDARQLDDGMSLTEYDDQGIPGAEPPGLMERPEVRNSDIAYSDHHRKTLEMIGNVNATMRGAAESEIKSGADRALIATMAVRANSKHQRALAKFMRSVLNGRVKLYKSFANEERMVEIAGRDKSGHVATFTRDEIQQVRRVRVDLGPPDLRTAEGKMALAKEMLEAYGPEVISPDKYMALRTIGRIDELDNSVAEHRVNARRENDMCREGQGAQLQAILTDHHACHIREHVRELNDPAIRFDPTRLTQAMALLNHITEHAQQWAGAPPELLAATGQDPAPSTLMGAPPGMPANDNGAPPMGAMPPGAPPPANDNGMGAPPMDVGQGGPQLPQMPMVAGSNQRFAPGQMPPDGGMQ